MRQSLVAMAEPRASLADLAERFGAALGPLGADVQTTVPYGGQAEQEAVIEVGPADVVSVSLREGLLLVQAETSPCGPGYHLRVVEVLETLAPLLPGGWTRVEDTTGYWSHPMTRAPWQEPWTK